MWGKGLTWLQPNQVGAYVRNLQAVSLWSGVRSPSLIMWMYPGNPCPQQYPEASCRWLQTYAGYRAQAQPHSSLLTGMPWTLWA